MLLVVALVAGAGGCSVDRFRGPPAAAPDTRLVVASFDFDESRLLAEIYAQALEHAGIEVRRELGLGPRELVLPALQQGLVDLVPEYVGSALAAARIGTAGGGTTLARTEARNTSAAVAALADALDRWDVEVLAPSPAQDQNALVVTRSLALSRDLQTISDLARVAPTAVLGGPAECPERPYCLRGLREVYGLDFAEFTPVDGAARTRQSLVEGVIDVAVLFTTDGHLADRELVLLEDDRALNPVENVVPVVRGAALERHGPTVAATVDRVSATLTTTMLRFLNWRVSVAGHDVAAEARGWLLRQGLVPR